MSQAEYTVFGVLIDFLKFASVIKARYTQLQDIAFSYLYGDREPPGQEF
jgi:hypothetical protein